MNMNKEPHTYVSDVERSRTISLIEKPHWDYLVSDQFEIDVRRQAQLNAANVGDFTDKYFGTQAEIEWDYPWIDVLELKKMPANRFLRSIMCDSTYAMEEDTDAYLQYAEPSEYLTSNDADPETVLDRTRAQMGYYVTKLASDLSRASYSKELHDRFPRELSQPQS